VVETATLASTAPIDTRAVAGWLKRVPKFQLDGHRPTSGEVAARLAAFWVPSRSVVYIGRTTQPLVDRIADYYTTPLGNRSPHAGGHWIKTLRVLPDCCVYWATADDPFGLEGALLTRFAATVPASEAATLFDPERVLPFANLADAHKRPKRHAMRYQRLP
jgi:hypothetical protein